MKARAPLLCKRRGCGCRRESGHFLCLDCWREVPLPARDRYCRARRRRLTRIASEIRADILRTLGRKPDPIATATYARTCALLGERAETEPAT